MSLLKKFAGETIIYGLGSILPRILNFGMTFLLTWVLGQGEFGQFGNMYAFTALILVFFTYGMETAFFRFSNDKKIKFNHDKFSLSKYKTLRGIHCDFKSWKMITSIYGKFLFVVVDMRKNSKDYLKNNLKKSLHFKQ